MGDPHPHRGKVLGHQRGRADKGNLGSELGKELDIGSGHAAEEDVPDDGHADPLDPPEFFADREGVEKPLGRMLVGPVTRIDHRGPQPVGEKAGASGGFVTDHNQVCAQGLKVARRIEQGLSFFEAGGRGGNVHDIGTETHRCKFE